MKKQKAFTLIEILIVITIIAVLTVALARSFSGAQERARDTARKSIVKTVQVGVTTFNTDYFQNPDASFCLEPADGIDIDSEISVSVDAFIADYLDGQNTSITETGTPDDDGCYLKYTSDSGTQYIGVAVETPAQANSSAIDKIIAPANDDEANFYVEEL